MNDFRGFAVNWNESMDFISNFLCRKLYDKTCFGSECALQEKMPLTQNVTQTGLEALISGGKLVMEFHENVRTM